jgi:hypothetical protein
MNNLKHWMDKKKHMCLVLFEITKVRFSNIREPEESPYIQKTVLPFLNSDAHICFLIKIDNINH